MPMATRPAVVIVGGGFGGLAAARALARAPVDVTLVDRTNHHLFQPLLYQVATARACPRPRSRTPSAASCAGSAMPACCSARRSPILPAAKRVRLGDGELPYDRLIVAAGAAHSYFGKDEWQRARPGPQDARGRARDPPARAPRLRAGGAGGGRRGPPPVAHVRGDRRRADRRRDGGGLRRDRAPHALRRLPAHRPAHRARPPARGGPSRAVLIPRGSLGEGEAPARGARRAGLDRHAGVRARRALEWRPAAIASPRARSSGRPASRARRSRGRSGRLSTGRGACASCPT